MKLTALLVAALALATPAFAYDDPPDTVRSEIAAKCSAKWQNSANAFSMTDYCISNEIEAWQRVQQFKDNAEPLLTGPFKMASYKACLAYLNILKPSKYERFPPTIRIVQTRNGRALIQTLYHGMTLINTCNTDGTIEFSSRGLTRKQHNEFALLTADAARTSRNKGR